MLLKCFTDYVVTRKSDQKCMLQLKLWANIATYCKAGSGFEVSFSTIMPHMMPTWCNHFFIKL